MKLRKLRAKKYLAEYIQELNFAVLVICFIAMVLNTLEFKLQALGVAILVITIVSSIIEVISQVIITDLDNNIKRREIIDRAKRI